MTSFLQTISIKEILELSALFLGFVNGLILLQNYLRDRPILEVEPVHPEDYQGWFEIPIINPQKNSCKYGYITYIGIGNKGLRKTSLKSWRLFIKTTTSKHQQQLFPLSIGSPKLEIDDYVKRFNVIGIHTEGFSGETIIEPGCSISGFAYYVYSVKAGDRSTPIIRNNNIEGEMVIVDNFGHKAKKKLTFKRVEYADVARFVPGLEQVSVDFI